MIKDKIFINLIYYYLSSMSGIIEDKCKDLYDQILQNPDYLTTQSHLVEGFLAKLTKQTVLRCHYCIKQIKQFQLISQGKHLYCITCFSHIILEIKQPYLVINLSKTLAPSSSLNLAQELKIINTIKQYGIEHQRVRNGDLSIFNKNLHQQELIQDVNENICQVVQSKRGSLIFSQYSINDYMHAYMHEKTNHKLKTFLLQRKCLEQKQKEEMIRDIDKICKSENDQAEIDEDSECSIDFERIKTDTKGIFKTGKTLLKKIRIFIKKNEENKQKKISLMRRFRANKIIHSRKVDPLKKPSQNISHYFPKRSTKK